MVNVIGRYCMVRDGEHGPIVLANVIDKIAGTNKAKRIRLQTGDHAGEVRMRGEYEFLEFIECGDAPTGVAGALAVSFT